MTNSISKIPLHEHISDASRLVIGGMNWGGWNANPITADDKKQVQSLLEACIECGINLIDLADIYTHGKAESIVGKVFAANPSLAESFYLQSKLGIRLVPGVDIKHYDLSGEYIRSALKASLKRLQAEKLDVLFLHRPDPLADVNAMAKTLNELWHDDKFDFLAVSNMHAGQLAMIQQLVEMPVIANQLEMSLLHSDFVEDAITVNMSQNASVGFPRGTLEFCMQQNVQLQAWSASAQGQFTDLKHDNPNIAATAKLMQTLAEKYATNVNALVIAWLLKHPANIQPVVGTTNPERLKEMAQASAINMSRSDWYLILETRRGNEVP